MKHEDWKFYRFLIFRFRTQIINQSPDWNQLDLFLCLGVTQPFLISQQNKGRAESISPPGIYIPIKELFFMCSTVSESLNSIDTKEAQYHFRLQNNSFDILC